MDTVGHGRTTYGAWSELVTEVRASRARLFLLRWVVAGRSMGAVTASDAGLAALWELEPRSVRRARTWLVGHGIISAERKSKGIKYELRERGEHLAQAVEASITRSRSGGNLREAMRRIMRHCAEFKGSVLEVAAVFGVEVTHTLREAVAYAVAYDGIGTNDYADAAYNLGRKAKGYKERGDAFGIITAEEWLYRMAKKWRWIPTETEAESIKTRREKARPTTYRPAPVVESPPNAAPVLDKPSIGKRKIANTAAECGAHAWAWLRMLRVERVTASRIMLNTVLLPTTSCQNDADEWAAARSRFKKQWGAKYPDCEVVFMHDSFSDRETILEIAKRV